MSSISLEIQLRLSRDVPKCKYCLQQFTIYKKKNESRRAILLPCGHNICEKCFYNTNIHTIKCLDCSYIIKLSSKMHQRRKLAEYNYFLFGKINTLINNKVDLSGSVLSQAGQTCFNHQTCTLCYAETIYKCIECDKIFCLNCFQINHVIDKQIQKHSLTRIDIKLTEKVIFDGKCKKHSNCDLQYYCNDCKYALCSNCIPLHTNHVFKILLAQNSEQETKLMAIRDAFESAKNVNENSIKEIKYRQDLYNEHKTKTVNGISNFFLYYHGLLQNVENKLLKSIDDNAMKINNDFSDINSSLLQSKELIGEYLLKLNSFAEETPANNDLFVVIEKCNSTLSTLGCVIETSNLCENNPYSFNEIQPPTINGLESLFQFNINTEYCKPKIKTFFENNKNNFKDEVPIDNKTLLNVSCASKIHADSNAQTNICKETMSFDMKFEEVIVTHIKTPSLFFIQSKPEIMVVLEINNWCLNKRNQLKKADIIQQNNIYIILDTFDNKWYRVKVIKMIKIFAKDKVLYDAMYIDFGNKANVEKERLYELPSELSKYPVCVRKCSLYNIKPKNNWTNEINQLMIDIVANKIVNMLIFDVINGTHYVELITISNDYPVSVRDALLYSELISNDEKISCSHSYIFNESKEALTNYHNKMLPINEYNNETFLTVKVLNIISPTNFYLINLTTIDELNMMMLKLNEKYNDKNYSNNLRLYLPKDNMICAVLFPSRIYVSNDEETILKSNISTWYRGKILSTSSKDFCEVYLVDYGRIIKVNYTYLYILDDNFIVANEFALNCALIDIKPVDNNDYIWSLDAINDFKTITSKNLIQIYFYKKTINIFGVTMFVMKRKMDICINALLVKMNHATSIGFESRFVNFNKTGEILKSNEDKKITKKVNDVDEKSLISVKESNPNSTKPIKVMITNAISPSEFYICLIKHLNGIKKMHNEIQKYMKNKNAHRQIETIALINEKYLGFTTKNNNNIVENDSIKQWYRIRIIKELQNNNYMVLLCDFGVIKEINAKNIYSINNININNVCDGIIKCSLAHIKPTGGLKSWLYTSIDTFNAIVEKYNEFSITLDNVNNFNNDDKSPNTLTVILFGLKNKINDALTPHFDNWININKMLVNRGVAHPMTDFHNIREPNYDMELFNIDFSIKNCLLNNDNDNSINSYSPEHYYHKMLNDNITDVTNWLPAKEIEKTIFTAIPTYVTNTGIIYLHDTEQSTLLNNMLRILYDKYINMNNETNDINTFNKNQQCIVRYHLDNYFYRGLILKKYSKKRTLYFHVLFIDFGNIEKCKLCDLYLEVILNEIPIQTSKFCLNNIKPLNGDTYNTSVTDYIHGLIVNKQCSIRVADVLNNNERIKKCDIGIGKLILNNVLLQQKYAIEDKNYNLNDVNIDKYDYYESDNENSDTDSDVDDDNLKSILCRITDQEQTNIEDHTENDIKTSILHLSINDVMKQVYDNHTNFLDEIENDDDDDINIFNPLEFETSTKYNDPLD